MFTKLQIIYLIFSLISFLIIFFWIVKTEKRLRRFFLGKKAKDLEETIINLEKNISQLEQQKEEIKREISNINQKLKKSIRGLETVRFNPFPDQGSNQSFAIGMQNEEGDGVIISSLYSRDRMSIFAKPIKQGKSNYELTEEEKQVLEKSKI